MLKKEGCFFNVVLSEICIRFSDKTKTRLGALPWRGVAGVVGFREESKRDSVKRVGLEIHGEFVFLAAAASREK